MSSEAQKPEIINRQELKTEAKWLKMEKINWKDQDGKEVSYFRGLLVTRLTIREYGNVPTDPRGPKLGLIVCYELCVRLMISGPYLGFVTSPLETCFNYHH
jgi:hypothetical protein